MIKAGDRLKEVRVEKKLTIEDVSKATKIKTDFLNAIEIGRYDLLPSSAYAQGFVRNYARFLGLPEGQILAIFRREFDTNKPYEVLPKGFSKTTEFSIGRFKLGRNLILVSFLVVILLAFISYQYRYAFISPSLEVKEPKPNEVINSLSLTISGKTDPDATVLIQEQPVVIQEDGSFIKRMAFFPGKTTISVEALNRFGRETLKMIPIDVKPAP